jgi:hypothetical protein
MHFGADIRGVEDDNHFYGFYGFGCAGRRSFFQENRGVLLSWFGCFALLGDSRYGPGRRLALTGRSQPRILRTNPDLWRAQSLFREPDIVCSGRRYRGAGTTEASVFARHCAGQRIFDGVRERAAVHRC